MRIAEIILYSNALHSQQLLTGFELLRKSGLIEIEKVTYKPLGKGNFFGEPFVKVLVGNKVVLYDSADSHYLTENNILLNGVTTYFKRSFRKEGYSNTPFLVLPLGLNYLVYSDFKSNFLYAQLRASFHQKNLLHFIATRMKIVSEYFGVNSSVSNCHYTKMYDYYDTSKSNKIIYNTRLWNPENARSNEERDKRILLNSRRIDFVSELKNHFGSNYVGGIFPDEYSRGNAPSDILIQNLDTYKKSGYLDLLRECRIGISVNGEHSAGWAIGEYVAFGLGVVCDPITIELPGNFEKNKNFIEVRSASELIEACNLLMSDEVLLENMISNNYQYYFSNLMPEALILSTFKRLGF
jgi:hypothetical protein